jgi:hypothetical protein
MKIKLVGQSTSAELTSGKLYEVEEYDKMTDGTTAHGAWITADNDTEYYVLFNGKQSICAHLTEGSYWEVEE